MRLCYSFLAFAMTLPLSACSRSNQVELADGQQRASSAEAEQSEDVAPAIATAVESIAQLEQRIASHRGKVVVVDLWALW